MCTLIVYYHLHPEYPFIIAANRDEQRNRESLPPHCIRAGEVEIYAGRDLVGGGTWLGMNTNGLLVGITNRRSTKPLDPARRSRGLLCLDALSMSSARAVHDIMQTLKPDEYNPFNLFYADFQEAFVTHYDGTAETKRLEKGLYVLASKDLNDQSFPRLGNAYRLAKQVSWHSSLPTILGQLQEICRNHEGGPPLAENICVHNGAYGTVSSTILALPRGEHPPVYLFAPGNPCVTPYQDYSFLLQNYRVE